MSLDIVKKASHILNHHMAKISLVDAKWPWYLFYLFFNDSDFM